MSERVGPYVLPIVLAATIVGLVINQRAPSGSDMARWTSGGMVLSVLIWAGGVVGLVVQIILAVKAHSEQVDRSRYVHLYVSSLLTLLCYAAIAVLLLSWYLKVVAG